MMSRMVSLPLQDCIAAATYVSFHTTPPAKAKADNGQKEPQSRQTQVEMLQTPPARSGGHQGSKSRALTMKYEHLMFGGAVVNIPVHISSCGVAGGP